MDLLKFIKEKVKEITDNFDSAHDYAHHERVAKMAKRIAQELNIDDETTAIILLGSWLHELRDSKFTPPSNLVLDIENKIENLSFSNKTRVINIVNNVSYTKQINQVVPIMYPIEVQIVQDADKLDAMGIIGGLRTALYSGAVNRSLNDTVQHYREKLVNLYKMLNTEPARRIGKKRHENLIFMLRAFEEEMEEIQF